MHKGQVLSEEHKAKLLKVNKGKVLSEETKAKISLAHKGKKLSAETRAKLSLAHRGRIVSAESRIRYSLASMGRKHSEEAIAKMRRAKTGKVASGETRAKMSESGMGRIASEETRAKLKQRWQVPGYREKMRLAHKGRIYSAEFRESVRERWQDPIYREKTIQAMRVAQQKRRKEASIISKRMWKRPGFKDRTVRASRLAMSIHPNKPETIIMGMLESICPGEFKFVGDGQVIIAGKNPDFININGHKQIIELFGNYWHGKRARCFEETEKGRIKLFKQYGFDTLIIWERELKTPAKVAERITNFTKKNCFEGLLKETA